jgi:hypothetical protein
MAPNSSSVVIPCNDPSNSSDDPPRSDVIDAVLTHLIESRENLEQIQDEYSPQTLKDCLNTSIIGLRYRTSMELRWW